MPEGEQVVFAGKPQVVSVRFENDDPGTRENRFRYRIFQLSSTLARPVHDWQVTESWVIPGKSILEKTLPVTLPEVRLPTRFEIRLGNDQDLLQGRIPVLALPSDHLKELTPILSGTTTALYDPEDLIRPALEAQGVSWKKADGPRAALGLRPKCLIMISPELGRREEVPWRKLAAKGVMLIQFRITGQDRGSHVPVCFIDRPARRAVMELPENWFHDFGRSASSQYQFTEILSQVMTPESIQP